MEIEPSKKGQGRVQKIFVFWDCLVFKHFSYLGGTWEGKLCLPYRKGRGSGSPVRGHEVQAQLTQCSGPGHWFRSEWCPEVGDRSECILMAVGPAGRGGGSRSGQGMFYPDSWLPGFLPAFEPASPHWCCELPDNLLLLFKSRITGFSHFQWRVLCELRPCEGFLCVGCGTVVPPLEGLKNTDAWALRLRFWNSQSWGILV